MEQILKKYATWQLLFKRSRTTPFTLEEQPVSRRNIMGGTTSILIGSGYSMGPVVMGPLLNSQSYGYSWKNSQRKGANGYY